MATRPFNLTTPAGDYWECWTDTDPGDVFVRHFDLPGASGSTVKVTATTDCSNPRLCVLPNRRALLTYDRPFHIDHDTMVALVIEDNDPVFPLVDAATASADFPAGVDARAVYECYSDNEGATWTGEVRVTPYGVAPAAVVNPAGMVLRTFARDLGFPYSPADPRHPSYPNPSWVLFGTQQEAGESAPGGVFTLKVPDIFSFRGYDWIGVLGMAGGYGAGWWQGRLWVHATTPTSGVSLYTALFWSSDEGKTWTFVPFSAPLSGKVIQGPSIRAVTNCGLAADPNCVLLLWGYSSSGDYLPSSPSVPGYALVVQRVGPGDRLDVSAPPLEPSLVLRDATGGAFDQGFEEMASFAQAYEGPLRWILATRKFGETAITTHWSGDDGASVTAF